MTAHVLIDGLLADMSAAQPALAKAIGEAPETFADKVTLHSSGSSRTFCEWICTGHALPAGRFFIAYSRPSGRTVKAASVERLCHKIRHPSP